MKLNIGCGYEKKEGYINIDKAKHVKPDKVVDIENGLPFDDEIFDEIYSEHCLEHVRPEKWKFVLNEIARVAKPNALLHLKLPFDNMINRTNVDHYRTFTWWSFGPLGPAREGKDTDRTYYSDLVLERLDRDPSLVEKTFFTIFNFLKNEVEFKFRVVKS